MSPQVPKDSILEVWYGKQSNVADLNNKGYKALYSSCWYLDHTKYGSDWVKYYRCEPSPYGRGKLIIVAFAWVYQAFIGRVLCGWSLVGII